MGSDETAHAVTNRSARPRTQYVLAWAGYLVFGLPAVLAVWALVQAVGRFGVGQTLIGAGPSMLWMELPLIAWIVYTVRRPQSRRPALLSIAGLALITATLLLTPMFFWTGPAFLVLLIELARVLIPARRRASAPQETS
ncbi:MAG: hypothetical protein ACRDWD_05560 [Acidimicrobiia bacterium]